MQRRRRPRLGLRRRRRTAPTHGDARTLVAADLRQQVVVHGGLAIIDRFRKAPLP
jgi:hypothetical protein